MTSSSGSGHEAKFHDYPLNATRSDLDVEDLHLYNKKLEHKIPTLFVQASANCQVELWLPRGQDGCQGKSATRTSPVYQENTNIAVRRTSMRAKPALGAE
jgi:hypothetical protein